MEAQLAGLQRVVLSGEIEFEDDVWYYNLSRHAHATEAYGWISRSDFVVVLEVGGISSPGDAVRFALGNGAWA